MRVAGYMGCSVCGLLNGMCALVGYVSCWIKKLQYIWSVESYVGCCIVCGLLIGIWTVVWYVGCCMICGLLYGKWVVVWYVGCCI